MRIEDYDDDYMNDGVGDSVDDGYSSNRCLSDFYDLKIETATVDKPAYVSIDLRDDLGPDSKSPFWSGVAAISGVDDERVRITFIEKGTFFQENNAAFREPEPGTIFWARRSDVYLDDVLEETPSLAEEYKVVQDMHENTPYTIVLQEYSYTPRYSVWDELHEFPIYDPVDGTKQVFTPPVSEVSSIDDAERWVIKNHPEFYMGMSAYQTCPSGDFRVLAVPGCSYPEGTYETKDARIEYAKKYGREELGMVFPEDEMANKRRNRVAAAEALVDGINDDDLSDERDFGD